jgi:tetratricopeptide (TPR) repeat protein
MQIASGHAELGLQICLDWTRKDGKNAEPTDTRNNLGIPDRDQNRIEDARKEYEETLKTYRELAQKDPETYLPYVAATLNDLGILDSDQNRMEEARKEFEESLKIYRKLVQKDPATYLPYVAITRNNLGNLDSAQNLMGDVAESAVRQNFGTEAIIGRRDASEYTEPLPMNLGTAHFTVPCGCRAWPLPF